MNVAIVGAGAAGMMAAIKASEKHDVVIIEKNKTAGRKLFITGKGRCNLTNACDISEYFDNIPRNPDFLYSALYTFSNEQLMAFFQEKGVPLKIERGNRVFPESDKSSEIIKALTRELEKRKVAIRYDSEVTGFQMKVDHVEGLKTSGGMIKADHYIVTSGGGSYPLTGSDGKMLRYLGAAGIKTRGFIPSLIPFTVNEGDVIDLAGVSLKNVSFSLFAGKTQLYSELGEMLFTHDGVSGPIVLSASCVRSEDQPMHCTVDLKPGLDERELDARILRDFDKYKNKSIKNGLSDLLIQRLIPYILKRTDIDPEKKVNEITKEERKRLGDAMKHLRFTIKGTRPLAEAIISRGGIDVTEVDPSTMKLKKITNLSVAGEILDVDAFTGGFNLQIAFSTGWLAGGSI